MQLVAVGQAQPLRPATRQRCRSGPECPRSRRSGPIRRQICKAGVVASGSLRLTVATHRLIGFDEFSSGAPMTGRGGAGIPLLMRAWTQRRHGLSRSSTFGGLRTTSWDHLGGGGRRLAGRARAQDTAGRRVRARPSRFSRPGQVHSAGTAMPVVTEALRLTLSGELLALGFARHSST